LVNKKKSVPKNKKKTKKQKNKTFYFFSNTEFLRTHFKRSYFFFGKQQKNFSECR